jgi:serine/threonine protein kinase
MWVRTKGNSNGRNLIEISQKKSYLFLAPEIIRMGMPHAVSTNSEIPNGYSFAVDMWSLGVSLYLLYVQRKTILFFYAKKELFFFRVPRKIAEIRETG